MNYFVRYIGMGLYQLHGDGTIWVYTGPPLPGWQMLDNNPRTRAVISAEPVKIWARLNFSMQHQMQTNWCWAANPSSVNAFLIQVQNGHNARSLMPS